MRKPKNTKTYRSRTPVALLHPEWVGVMKECPECKETKEVTEYFGLRTQNGKVLPSSWCRVCRSASVERAKDPHLPKPQADR